MSLPIPQPQQVFPSQERMQQEIAVALSIIEQYGTNQPGKTYEDGIADALLWTLGGPEPQAVEE
jgi:hypothetical protein